ncbi:unnamed protein product, partial [Sphacelaria rigidula]
APLRLGSWIDVEEFVYVMGDGRVLQLGNIWTEPACQGWMKIWRQLPPRRGP